MAYGPNDPKNKIGAVKLRITTKTPTAFSGYLTCYDGNPYPVNGALLQDGRLGMQVSGGCHPTNWTMVRKQSENLAKASEGWPNLTKPLDIPNSTQQFKTANSTPEEVCGSAVISSEMKSLSSDEIKLVKQALPFAEFSDLIYKCDNNDCKADANSNTPSGWVILDESTASLPPVNPQFKIANSTPSFHPNPIGFHAVAYRNRTGLIAIVFEGTTNTPSKDFFEDWYANISQVNTVPQQYSFAVNFTENFIKNNCNYMDCKNNIVITGHSLGGGLAQYVALTIGMKAYIFNAANLWVPTIEPLKPSNIKMAKIIRFISDGYVGNEDASPFIDLVSRLGSSLSDEQIHIPVLVCSKDIFSVHSMDNLFQAMEKLVDSLPKQDVGNQTTPTANSEAKKGTRAGCNMGSSVALPSIGGAQGALKKFGTGTDGCTQ